MSPGLTGLSGRIADTRPPSDPVMPGSELLPNVLPLMLTIRPSDATFMSTLVVVVVVVVLVVQFTVIFIEVSLTATETSAVPVESTDFTVRVSLAVMSRNRHPLGTDR